MRYAVLSINFMKTFQLVIAFLTTFVIVTGGAVLVIITSGNSLNSKAIIPCAVLGVVLTAKELRSLLQLPPLSNGNYAAIKQLLDSQPKPPEPPKP